jgi:hypothetical protein
VDHFEHVCAHAALDTDNVVLVSALGKQTLLWAMAEAGDVRAAASVLRIIEQRVRLLGLEDRLPAANSASLTLVSLKAPRTSNHPTK